MAASLCNVNQFKRKVILVINVLALGVMLCTWAGAEEPFAVAPVTKPDELRLLPANAWPPPESEGGEMLIKLFYLRGMLDALQYVEVAPKSTGKALKKLEGLNLQQLAALVDRFYLADPRRRDLPPAAVVLRILPEQRQGK
ncbi:MAG: hypothetical protein PVG03_07125 [Desulfarculaceae bacterium]|jgi:hypothetical protein